MGFLISFASSDEEMWKGYLYMAVLVLLNILKTLLTSQNIYQLAKLGLRIRTALTSSLYKKALSLNPKARQEQTGKILNNKHFVILHFINIFF